MSPLFYILIFLSLNIYIDFLGNFLYFYFSIIKRLIEMKLKNIQKKLKKKSNKVNYKIIEEVQIFWRKLINCDNFSEN